MDHPEVERASAAVAASAADTGAVAAPAGRGAAGATRRAALAAPGAAAAGWLAACAGGGESSTPGGPGGQPAAVRYLHVDTGQQVWQENWEQIFGAFRTRYPNVTLQIDSGAFGDPVIQKAISTFAAGDYYDVLYGHNSFVAPWLGADLLQPLDAYLSKDREVRADDFHPAATERLKGKLYGIAWFVVGAETWYNADLLAQMGAPNPRQLEREGKWTWDALLDLARKATRTAGDQTTVWGFDAPFNQVLWFNHSLWGWGAEPYDKGFTRPTFDSTPAVNATQFAVDMVARHRVSGPGDFTKSALASRLVSTSYIRTIEEQVMRQNPFKVEMTMIPKGPSGRAVGLTNNASYLARGAKAPEAAWLFYKHLIGKDVQPQMARLGGGRYTASKKLKPTVLYPYEDATVYEAAAAISRPMPLIARQADLDREWRTVWGEMSEGKKGVREGLLQTQERATQLLKDGGCLC
jgi:multiple sugar transport system substrate-binding protein